MPPRREGNVLNWASVIDDATLSQAHRTADLPIVHGHVALMPDAHLGMGATIGSVIPTRGAIIPAAVGVDIGCGMVAAETSLTSHHLPDDLERFLQRLVKVVPAGIGQGHSSADDAQWRAFLDDHGWPTGSGTDDKQRRTAAMQFGTLGSGNHFWELCLDERDRVWIVLHSGSRGIGNQLAQRHIARAKKAMKDWAFQVEDPDLAYFVQDMPEFQAYIDDVQWAQAYAFGNRRRMVDSSLALLAKSVGQEPRDVVTQVINCHHNYAAYERHNGVDLWITRKGAILARDGDLGVIPGSMGSRSYIVRGKGNPLSYNSCAHGAGRVMSRRQARKQFSSADLELAMEGRTWLRDSASRLVDEIPGAYKPIDQVMQDQADLVEVLHELHQIVNYKGTS
jgi:tRNA-splicing ligase RtcB (3'-phosphate/5'-hydroxy nucleic acid ligase)